MLLWRIYKYYFMNRPITIHVHVIICTCSCTNNHNNYITKSATLLWSIRWSCFWLGRRWIYCPTFRVMLLHPSMFCYGRLLYYPPPACCLVFFQACFHAPLGLSYVHQSTTARYPVYHSWLTEGWICVIHSSQLPQVTTRFHRNQKHVGIAVANKVWKQVWT